MISEEQKAKRKKVFDWMSMIIGIISLGIAIISQIQLGSIKEEKMDERKKFIEYSKTINSNFINMTNIINKMPVKADGAEYLYGRNELEKEIVEASTKIKDYVIFLEMYLE